MPPARRGAQPPRPSSWREPIPSLRYALLRCTSTVFGVTYSDCAMSRFDWPSAASVATRCSLAVSDATPCRADVRGRAPVA